MPNMIDETDQRILKVIQGNAALSVADIADAVGLSTSPCWRRIKRMEDNGVIKSRITVLDAAQLGLDFEVFVNVKLTLPNRENMDIFEAEILNMPEVVQCSVVTGSVDFMLRVVTQDMNGYDAFLRESLLQIGLVSDVQSHIVMRHIKDGPSLPIGLLGTKSSA